MNPVRRRLVAFVPLCAVLAGVLLWGLASMPSFGRPHSAYARYVSEHAASQRHVSNVVTSIVFDYRGWDTLAEELIMFAAVMGTALLLRSTRDVEEERPRDRVSSDVLRRTGLAAVPGVLLVGLWTVAFGYVTPGGGFQGGVVGGSAAFLTWVAGSYRRHRELTPVALVDTAEGAAVLGYVGVGLAGLAAGAPYLANVLGLGTTGSLASGGTIAVLNGVTGVGVAAATVLIFHEFLEEYVQTLPDAPAEAQE